MPEQTSFVSSILDTSTVVAAKHPRMSEVDEEMVIVDLEIQEFYGLNLVGASIWKLIQQPQLVSDIQQKIAAEYKIELEQCRQDVLAFLNDLAAANLIEVQNSG